MLCSPSSVVDLIEPGVMEFDLVIFDEASQITVPEAMGALGRARAAIVVGDSKQMPPTRRIGGGATDDEDIDDADFDEIVEDQESILSECELARVPALRLNWHYRSQDESLIAFSNNAYYRGELSSFPTPTLLSSETGIQFRRVRSPETDDKGMYLRAGAEKMGLGDGVVAGTNTNPREAREIVRYVHELVSQSTKLPSVGIVTFNEQQRQLIEDLLHASHDPRIADVMNEDKMGRGEALFVKALEQVQGDERDVVIFSIAFSKQANNRIPTNFGPLSNSGGERRLNVAITRARRRNVVFCSFDPSELNVDDSTYEGPKDLKKFLMFAKAQTEGEPQEQGGRTAAARVVRDRHRDDIARALEEAGLHVMSDVGMSNFRIDLVLARGTDPSRPILPVLLDGESWRQRSTVSDRDVLPVEVLRNLMGWPAVARIWWPMWLQNPQAVVEGILIEVDRAEAMLDAAEVTSSVPDPTPATAESPVRGMDVPLPKHQPLGSDAEPVAADRPRPYIGRRFALDPEDDLPGSTIPASAPVPAAFEESVAVEGPGPSGPERSLVFVPAHTNLVGSKEVLDALPGERAASTVREQILEVIGSEGPVEVARLVRIIGRRFGLAVVRSARAEEIRRLIPADRLRKSALGEFAWPADLDMARWSGFRPADADHTRSLDEVAPEEIANAMRSAIALAPMGDRDDILRSTAEIFGIARLGANVRARLDAVYAQIPRS